MKQNWPELDWTGWQDTCATLHMMTQIVGKTRVGLTPIQNHWWNVPLYITARGMSTSPMPMELGDTLDIEFDLVAHQLVFRTSSAQIERIALRPKTVADFYREYLEVLKRLGIHVHIDAMPVELKEPIRFDLDTTHKSYDREAVSRFFQVLRNANTLFERFSTNFYGKISPVHFFWGSFDLAVTRFCGRRAPKREGADAIQAEAYSHECISAGFWPGNGGYGRAAFYAYAAPVPKGLEKTVLKGKGSFNQELGEFLLDYHDVRAAENPAQVVLDFLDETYGAAADALAWNRAELDRHDQVGEAATRID